MAFAEEELDNYGLNFPDLMSSETTSQLIKAIQARQLTNVHSSNVLKKDDSEAIKMADLATLEKGLAQNKILSTEQRVRLLMLLQELQGRPDDAYITLKTIKDSPKDAWYNMSELQLSERLGLDKDVQRLGKDLKPVFFNSDFKIEKIALCKSVQAFGQYEPFTDNDMKTGQLMILYVEYRGLFQEEKNGRYHSRYLVSFDVWQDDQIKVFHYDALPAEDIGYSERQEGYLWMKWRPALLPGKYKLKVRLVDDIKKNGVDFEQFIELKS